MCKGHRSGHRSAPHPLTPPHQHLIGKSPKKICYSKQHRLLFSSPISCPSPFKKRQCLLFAGLPESSQSFKCSWRSEQWFLSSRLVSLLWISWGKSSGRADLKQLSTRKPVGLCGFFFFLSSSSFVRALLRSDSALIHRCIRSAALVGPMPPLFPNSHQRGRAHDRGTRLCSTYRKHTTTARLGWNGPQSSSGWYSLTLAPLPLCYEWSKSNWIFAVSSLQRGREGLLHWCWEVPGWQWEPCPSLDTVQEICQEKGQEEQQLDCTSVCLWWEGNLPCHGEIQGRAGSRGCWGLQETFCLVQKGRSCCHKA